MGPAAEKRIRSRVLRDVARRPVVETGANVPGYSGGAERLSERFFGMRITGFVLADEDVSAPGPTVETGAGVPGQREVNFPVEH